MLKIQSIAIAAISAHPVHSKNGRWIRQTSVKFSEEAQIPTHLILQGCKTDLHVFPEEKNSNSTVS